MAEERFAELAAEVPCATRFIRATFADALEQLREGGVADLVTLDLGMSSIQVDTRERGFSYAYDAPLDMRMDPDQALTAAEIVNDWDERRLARAAARVRRGALRRPDRPTRVRPPPPRGRIETTQELVDVIKPALPAPGAVRRRPSGQARSFQAIRIAVNDELDQLDRALPPLGGVRAGRAASASSPSTRSRTAASSASWPTARAGASARPSCRCACAAASPRPSCSPAAPWRPRRARWREPALAGRACARHGSCAEVGA